MTIVPAWYGEKSLKESALKRLKWHREKDSFQQGIWFEINDDLEYRGCQLGCLCQSNWLSENGEDIFDKTSRLFGLPVNLVRLFESIFENLPNETEVLSDWVIDSTDAIEVGADLSYFEQNYIEIMEIWENYDKRHIENGYFDEHASALDFSQFIINKLKECPILNHQVEIPPSVSIDLCAQKLWCPSKELVNV